LTQSRNLAASLPVDSDAFPVLSEPPENLSSATILAYFLAVIVFVLAASPYVDRTHGCDRC
jgi:hypothetical protein